VAAASSDAGWEPAPATPVYDWPAGFRCDFPVRSTPIVDEVLRHVVETRPDGEPGRVAYKGPLVLRVTNTDTGSSIDVDAGGSALVEYRADGSQSWRAIGPVMAGWGENGGNLPRGLYRLDGVYSLEITAPGAKTLTMAHGTTEPLCPLID